MRKLSIRKPTAARLRMFLEEQASLDLTYREVGATMTASNLPIGYVVDRTQVELGSGAARFEAAKEAMRRWEPFQLGWVEAWPVETPLEEGQVVAIMGWAVGLWWLNSTRIVYVIDESGDMERFGFGYGTLPGHVERGEERFCIAWNRATDQVSYEIFAFSRPQHILARLGYPWVRRSQKRFARESAISMYRSVNGGDEVPLVSQSTD